MRADSSEVNGGATTNSTIEEQGIRDDTARRKAAVSDEVLFIFQLPTMRRGRTEVYRDVLGGCAPLVVTIGQRGETWQGLALQQFQRGTAAS